MKLLLDQNLSRNLPARLAQVFPESTHVRMIRFDQASDEGIWNYAKENGYCIVSRDADFVERSRLYGAPPKVVWLRCGNQSPLQTERTLLENAELIRELIENPNLHFVEIVESPNRESNSIATSPSSD